VCKDNDLNEEVPLKDLTVEITRYVLVYEELNITPTQRDLLQTWARNFHNSGLSESTQIAF